MDDFPILGKLSFVNSGMLLLLVVKRMHRGYLSKCFKRGKKTHKQDTGVL